MVLMDYFHHFLRTIPGVLIATKSISTTKGEASQAMDSITQNEYRHADCGLPIPFPNNLPEQRGEYCLSREEY